MKMETTVLINNGLGNAFELQGQWLFTRTLVENVEDLVTIQLEKIGREEAVWEKQFCGCSTC